MPEPEDIGAEITQEWEAKQKITRKASKFNVLAFVVETPAHIVKAEVALFNDDGVVGPAQWIALNPLYDDEGKEIDNWAKLQKSTLAQIPELVKAALQTWEVSVGA